MDGGTRLFVEVKKKVLYDPQNFLYKDLNSKEKA